MSNAPQNIERVKRLMDGSIDDLNMRLIDVEILEGEIQKEREDLREKNTQLISRANGLVAKSRIMADERIRVEKLLEEAELLDRTAKTESLSVKKREVELEAKEQDVINREIKLKQYELKYVDLKRLEKTLSVKESEVGRATVLLDTREEIFAQLEKDLESKQKGLESREKKVRLAEASLAKRIRHRVKL